MQMTSIIAPKCFEKGCLAATALSRRYECGIVDDDGGSVHQASVVTVCQLRKYIAHPEVNMNTAIGRLAPPIEPRLLLEVTGIASPMPNTLIW